jgi:hydroxyethylthiazole kinase-like uncharacterized protein yjeF
MSTIRIDSRVSRQALFGIAATRRLEAAAQGLEPPFTLMARAGEATARLALALAPHARHVVVFAGPGNNGGDGIEAATRLCEAGKTASVLLSGDAAALPADGAQALARATHVGVRIVAASSSEGRAEEGADLVIDALLGIGATRPPAAALAAAIDRIARFAANGVPVLAIDVPSGLDADRGVPFGDACVVAAHTLTLLTAKPGLFTAAGRDHAGSVWLDDLGVEAPWAAADAWLIGCGGAAEAHAVRRHDRHKGSFGDVAVVGGAPGMTGAALLAARAAHAAGAGRVFVALLDEGEASAGFDPQRPELMFRPGWWHGPVDTLAATTVVCGCGGDDAVRAVLPRLLSTVRRLVLDADALNAIAADSGLQALTAARATRALETILTPHPLEAARLLGTTAREVQNDRLRRAAEIAARYGAVVVLKGSGTVVAAAGATPCINSTGNAALASGGTGDVLAGWIGGRWQAGSDARSVAVRAVVEHGAAAEPERPGALLASDLIERMHERMRGG